MPAPGDILFYKDFKFEDGTTADKLFVILTATTSTTPYLALKTTSQSRRYEGVNQGCNSKKKVFFSPVSWQPCFDVDTYIQLPQIFEFSVADIIKAGIDKQIDIKRSLSQDCLAQLKNCLKPFKNDISPRHWKMIF